MNERVKFIARYLQDDESFSVIRAEAQISRKTAYKWVERYECGGVKALVDRSRAPLSHPHAVAADAVERILAERRRHPRWGPQAPGRAASPGADARVAGREHCR